MASPKLMKKLIWVQAISFYKMSLLVMQLMPYDTFPSSKIKLFKQRNCEELGARSQLSTLKVVEGRVEAPE
jgi:hypothetical protein